MRSYRGQPSGTVPELRRSRREAPEPERRLLRAVKEAFPDLKWRHQSPIGPYRVDLLCFSERLVIEVDGDSHAERGTHDARRTALMIDEGYRVIRFTNTEVMQNLDGVLVQISLSFQEREGAHSAQPSGKGEDRNGGQSSR